MLIAGEGRTSVVIGRHRSFGDHAPTSAPVAPAHAALDAAAAAGPGSPSFRWMLVPTALSAAATSAGSSAPSNAARQRGGRPPLMYILRTALRGTRSGSSPGLTTSSSVSA